MGPHLRWIPLLACVCMLTGGATTVSSEQSKAKAKGIAKHELKERKDFKAKDNKPRTGEARPGRNDDHPRLVQWDVNGDGMLQRGEWKVSLQLFDRLDVNHDNVLTADELARHP